MARTLVVPTATTREAASMAASGFWRHDEALRVQPHFFDDFGVQRLEGAEAHVQRHPRDGGPRPRDKRREFPGVKWSPAVGAATDPRSRANTVW